MRLTGLFGPLMEHVIKALRSKATPLFHQLGGEERKGNAGVINGEVRAGFFYLHQDGAYTPTVNRGAILRMVKTPKRGGDTIWIDTQKAYEALPQHLREICDTRSAIHFLREYAGRMYGWPHLTWRAPEPHEAPPPINVYKEWELPPVRHNLVMTNPETGKKMMIIDPLSIRCVEGMSRKESEAFFEELITFLVRPEFAYRHQWSVGDMVLYDNRRTVHGAFGYAWDDERIARRTDLAPPEPSGRYLTDAEMAEFNTLMVDREHGYQTGIALGQRRR
jgi:taurine dioxygenase